MQISQIAALLEPFLAPNGSEHETGRSASPDFREEKDGIAPQDRARIRGPERALLRRDGVPGGADLGVELAPAQLEQISTYIDLLLRWNARVNLTAIRNPEEIVTRHFGESLFLGRHLFPGDLPHLKTQENPAGSPLVAPSSNRIRVLDIGSGAGFPALPLKIWAPAVHLTLIESNHKKAAFLREVIRALTLMNVDVIADRAETILQRPSYHSGPSEESALLSPFDVVTFRAVENFDRTLRLAVRFLATNGRLAVLVGTAQLSKLGGLDQVQWRSIIVPESHSRTLALGRITNRRGPQS
ncbi:MAG: 16S rRNA (guanine(527)-N(7))-methyltransferase RsmG [Terriglobales bacterium]